MNATPESVYDWRLGVTAVLVCLIFVSGYHFMSIKGIPPFSIKERVVHIHDIEVIKKDIESIRDIQVAAQLISMQKDRCSAAAELKELLTREITNMKISFKNKNGFEFPLPECSEF